MNSRGDGRASRTRSSADRPQPSLRWAANDQRTIARTISGRSAELRPVTGSDREGLALDAARDLLTRAEVLAGDGDLITIIEDVLSGAEQAGADPGVVSGLLGALRVLDPGEQRRYDAGEAGDRRVNTGYPSEWEFLEGVTDAEGQVQQRRREAAALLEEAAALLEAAMTAARAAQDDLAAARAALSAAYAMPVGEPCTGCHGAKQAAINEAEAAEADAGTRLSESVQVATSAEAAIGVLEPYAAALVIILAKIRRVPADLGDVYELVHTYIRNGGKLPPFARWVEGSGGSFPAAGTAR